MSNVNVRFFNNDEGVSPIVATLVLIVVAIVGAAAVGLIMGSFSSNVAQQANSGDSAGQASTQVIMGGSTSVQPLAELIAKTYMANHTGVKITVQGGGSGAGEVGVAQGALDIGMASEDIFQAQKTLVAKYPNLKQTTIGGSGVVVITGKSVNVPATGVLLADLIAAYTPATTPVTGTPIAAGTLTGVDTVYTRAESSGTADAMGVFLFNDKTKIYQSANSKLVPETGNDGMLAAVTGNPTSLGYVDYGFASGLGYVGAASTSVPNVQDISSTLIEGQDGKYTTQAAVQYHPSATNIKNGLKDHFNGGHVANAYDILVRPLNLLTNGNPNTVEQTIISWFQQPMNQFAFGQTGTYSMADIGV